MTFCMVCQEDGHTQEICPNQKCRTCGKLGHGTRDCPNLVVSKNLSQPSFARKNNGKMYLILNYRIDLNTTPLLNTTPPIENTNKTLSKQSNFYQNDIDVTWK